MHAIVVRSNYWRASAEVLSGSLKFASPHINMWSWAINLNTKTQFLSFPIVQNGMMIIYASQD